MIKILLPLIILTVAFSASSAQEVDSIALKYGQTISKEDLKKHLTIIASDEFQGRDTGSKGQKMAAEYLVKHYSGNELAKSGKKEKTYFQPVPLEESSWDNPTIKIGNEEYKFLEDFYCYPKSSQVMDDEFNEVVFLGYGIADKRYDDYKKTDVKGKVLVISTGEPQKKSGMFHISGTEEASDWTNNWRKKLEHAKAKGVKALFIVDKDFAKNSIRYRPYFNSKGMKLRDGGARRYANTIYISPEMATRLMKSSKMDKWFKKINKKGKSKSKVIAQEIDFNIKKKENVFDSPNVMAYLEGTDLKDELLVITSHYDHVGTKGDKIFNGADDDGSGTVAVMEIAEAFAAAKKDGHGPRRSILFMNVTGEEKGLLGSEFYVNNPIYPLENTIANLNIDMVGRVDELHNESTKNYVYIIGADRLSTELHDINEKANSTYTKMNLDYKYNEKDDPNRYYYRSDHYNFAKNNIPVIFYYNGNHADYHKETDTVEKIAFDMLEKRARLVFYTAWQLVNQDKRIEVNVVEEEE